MNRSFADRLAQFYKMLADPTRLQIIHVLLDGERSVGNLAQAVGQSPSAVSHQLRLLKAERVVRTRREGHHIYYALDDAHVEQLYRLGIDHLSHD